MNKFNKSLNKVLIALFEQFGEEYFNYLIEKDTLRKTFISEHERSLLDLFYQIDRYLADYKD